MERKYLAALVALVATFVIFSNALRQENAARIMRTRSRLVSQVQCATRTIGTAIAANLPPILRRDSGDDADAGRVAHIFIQQKADTAQRKVDAMQAKLARAQAALDDKRAELQVAKARLAALSAMPELMSMAVPATPVVNVAPVPPLPPHAVMAIARSEQTCSHAAQAAARAQRAVQRANDEIQRHEVAMNYRIDVPQVDLHVNVPEGWNQVAYSFNAVNAKELQRQIKVRVQHELHMQMSNRRTGDM